MKILPHYCDRDHICSRACIKDIQKKEKQPPSSQRLVAAPKTESLSLSIKDSISVAYRHLVAWEFSCFMLFIIAHFHRAWQGCQVPCTCDRPPRCRIRLFFRYEGSELPVVLFNHCLDSLAGTVFINSTGLGSLYWFFSQIRSFELIFTEPVSSE